jgi:hypothetical protein
LERSKDGRRPPRCRAGAMRTGGIPRSGPCGRRCGGGERTRISRAPHRDERNHPAPRLMNAAVGQNFCQTAPASPCRVLGSQPRRVGVPPCWIWYARGAAKAGVFGISVQVWQKWPGQGMVFRIPSQLLGFGWTRPSEQSA